MLRPALVLLLLLVSVSQAATSMPPTGFPRLTLMTNGLKIESGSDGLTATRGGKTVWRTPGIFVFTLNAGPGRLITAEGLRLGPQGEEPTPRSLLIDPATGTLVASVSGKLVSVGSEAAIFLNLQAQDTTDSGSLMTLTRLPLATLRPEVRRIASQGLVPAACQTAENTVPSTTFVLATVPLRGPRAEKHMTIQLGTIRCDLTLKLTFATLKVELLDFKPSR